jgi:hypothetical protein
VDESGEKIARMASQQENIDWVALEKVRGGLKILKALQLALKGKSMKEIEQEAGVPYSSLDSIKLHGPYEHRNRVRSRAKNRKSPDASPGL